MHKTVSLELPAQLTVMQNYAKLQAAKFFPSCTQVISLVKVESQSEGKKHFLTVPLIRKHKSCLHGRGPRSCHSPTCLMKAQRCLPNSAVLWISPWPPNESPTSFYIICFRSSKQVQRGLVWFAACGTRWCSPWITAQQGLCIPSCKLFHIFLKQPQLSQAAPLPQRAILRCFPLPKLCFWWKCRISRLMTRDWNLKFRFQAI